MLKGLPYQRNKNSLNPCSNGMTIEFDRADWEVVSLIVLILVLME